MERRSPGLKWKAWLLAALFALPAGAAGLSPGQSLPTFTGEDLLGQKHASEEYKGQRTLLVAITDKDAGDALKHWFEAADQHIPGSVRRQSIISLHLPVFVSLGTVRSRAKPRVPQQYWEDTLLDKNGALAKALGLPSSQQPYAIALDERGQVLATLNGPVDSPDAARIWSALASPTLAKPTSSQEPAHGSAPK